MMAVPCQNSCVHRHSRCTPPDRPMIGPRMTRPRPPGSGAGPLRGGRLRSDMFCRRPRVPLPPDPPGISAEHCHSRGRAAVCAPCRTFSLLQRIFVGQCAIPKPHVAKRLQNTELRLSDGCPGNQEDRHHGRGSAWTRTQECQQHRQKRRKRVTTTMGLPMTASSYKPRPNLGNGPPPQMQGFYVRPNPTLLCIIHTI
jgi:hypothetical protein